MPKKRHAKSSAKTKSALSRFEVKQVRCVKTETQLKVRAGPIPKNTQVHISNSLEVSRHEGAIKCNVCCEVVSSYEDSDEPAVLIRCQFQVVYKCKTKSFPSKKTVESQQNQILMAAAIQAWPFIRHYVHWMTTQMGLPALTLPMMLLNSESDGHIMIGDTRLGSGDKQKK